MIGEKIRFLRQQNRLTQEELADRCELSKGFISLLERDLTSPSISTLISILDVLGTTPAAFFREKQEFCAVFSRDQHSVKHNCDEQSHVTWLIPNAQKNRMEPIILDLEPGGRTYPDTPHEGEEFGYLLQGEVVLCVGKNTYPVRSGESFFIRPEQPHYIVNESQGVARLIWVSSPPSF
ncbi:MAG: cupin domain-containing protein [Clostridiaceae bacterium]|nr:cupin domain-containing protein [Clostridiaceae bacterium]